MNRADRKRQAKEDERKIAHGVDPRTQELDQPAALARLLHALFERAKREKNIDPPLRFLYARLGSTLSQTDDIKLACRKGCSHCCRTWVSVSAPEALFVAKLIGRRKDSGAAADVRAAHLATKDYNIVMRVKQPVPCPMLKDDACTVYDSRPLFCRGAVSTDAAACQRAFREFSREPLPVPAVFQNVRRIFGVVNVAALRHAGLPHQYYEYNAALERALSRDDAEAAWLSGEDVFAGVLRDPTDTGAHPDAERIYRSAFLSAPPAAMIEP